MGAQKADPTAPNFDPQGLPEEAPVHDVRLSPYFLSKYEMTQGQWMRFVGKNPSGYGPSIYLKDWNRAGKGWTPLHPVEQVSWNDCMQVLGRAELMLPSEAQWENGCRAGTDTPWWTGSGISSLGGAANLADAYGKSHGGEALPVWEKEFDDGNTAHAEIGSYRPNAFGLHEVHGNVWEWCLDGYDTNFYGRSSTFDPVAPWQNCASRVNRGGSYSNGAPSARSASRSSVTPEGRGLNLGVRPAKSLQLPTLKLHH
jgi:formylglycine-generating enzyme required for sulfatase activity